MHNGSIDFRALHVQAMPYLPAIARRLLPDGRMQGQEYVARNPNRADRHLGSFKVNLHNGYWADFATGDKGGDVTSLVAYVLALSQADAAAWLARVIGRAA
jgi:hypothetical protein